MGFFEKLLRELSREYQYSQRRHRRGTMYNHKRYRQTSDPELNEKLEDNAKNMNYINYYREDMEKQKAIDERVQSQKREKYVWNDENSAMDDLAPIKLKDDKGLPPD